MDGPAFRGRGPVASGTLAGPVFTCGSVQSHTVVSLRRMTDANREAVEVLAVTPDQERFVSGVRESILEAAEEPDAQGLFAGRSKPKRRRSGS
jgi:hypothetical protein